MTADGAVCRAERFVHAMARSTAGGEVCWCGGFLRDDPALRARFPHWAKRAGAALAGASPEGEIEWEEPHPLDGGRRIRISASRDGADLVWLLTDIRRCAETCDVARRTREHLSMVLDTAPVGIWMQNGKGKLSFVNRAFCEAIGIPEERFLAVEHYTMLLPEQFTPMCFASDAKALASETPTVTIQQLPMADGQIHDLEVYKAVRRDAAGEPLALVGIAVEATAKLADARAMRQARETAESLNRAKSEFLRLVSHEMLTPLNGIVGFAQLLEMDEGSAECRAIAGDIRSSGEKLTEIIRAILDYAQLEARTAETSWVAFNPAIEITRLFDKAVSGRRDGDVALSCRVDPALDRTVVGDLGAVGRVLAALLRNALDFTSDGRIDLSAEIVEATADGIDAVLAVRDTGEGIPAGFMPHLFVPFRQADSSSTRRHGGIGLDLALSRRLAEHAGGQLTVESAEGRGTTARLRVRFDLPRMAQ